ncbi:MAG: HupE/UreJ family protein [Steroidobacteraceae bacterium]|nr:HupE/UreJ family protein [Steroidobacteraceae bacterium]
MKARAPRFVAMLLMVATTAHSHPAPNSTLRLDFEAHGVRAEYWLPVSELGYARAGENEPDLAAYLLGRLHAESPAGEAWKIRVKAVREDRYLEHDYLVAELQLAPPPGVAARPFVLVDDVITHEVRNHIVFVVENRPSGNRLIGMLQYPNRRLSIPPDE